MCVHACVCVCVRARAEDWMRKKDINHFDRGIVQFIKKINCFMGKIVSVKKKDAPFDKEDCVADVEKETF